MHRDPPLSRHWLHWKIQRFPNSPFTKKNHQTRWHGASICCVYLKVRQISNSSGVSFCWSNIVTLRFFCTCRTIIKNTIGIFRSNRKKHQENNFQVLQLPWKAFRIHIFTLSSSICFLKFRRNLIIPSISPRGGLDHWSCWCEQECLRICALVGEVMGKLLGQVIKYLFQKKMLSNEVQNCQGKSMQSQIFREVTGAGWQVANEDAILIFIFVG